MTASLAIQLVGLAVPVCTQIVIDKVVVHHTTSTLIVIGVALLIFLIFSSAMGWVRQYLVLHTGNRIDATLGHKVFSHLLDLPVRYYDNRPTGVIIARVHGVSGPVLRLVGLWQEFQQADIAVKRLGDVMNAPAEPMTLIPTRANVNQATNITVDSLGFKYADDLPWLYQNLSFNIQAGHCVLMMGPSGCGKSTLAKLLLGFYQPQQGNIKLNGQDIRYLAANELRNHFGVVPQETVIFSGTIYDNLILANPHASFEQIIQACQLAEIHQTIEKLPQGYQTTVGEHGTGLSGGQKQRIAIARALLKQPKVLIFDEAVSNLDQQTAEHFAQTVNKLKGKVTILFITHQLPKGLQVDEAVILGKENTDTAKRPIMKSLSSHEKSK